MEQVYRQKVTVTVMKMTNVFFYFFYLIRSGLAFLAIFVEFFKVIYLGLQSSDWLNSINLWSQETFVYIWTNVCLLLEIFVVNFDRDRCSEI